MEICGSYCATKRRKVVEKNLGMVSKRERKRPRGRPIKAWNNEIKEKWRKSVKNKGEW